MAISQDIQFRRLVDLRTRLDKFEDKSIKQTLAIFDKSINDLKRSLKKTKGITTKKQQRAVLKEIQETHKLLKKSLTKKLGNDLKKMGTDSITAMEEIYSWDGKDKGFNYVADRALRVADSVEKVPVGGEILNNWVEKTFDDSLAIQTSILSSRLKGESYQKMYKELVRVYPDKARRELVTLARTYNQSVAVSAQETIFEENKDLVSSVRWVAILEFGFSSSGRGTCPRCAGLDGTEYKEGEERPPMPLHARCRCMWHALTLTWEELFEKHRLRGSDGKELDNEFMREDYRAWTDREESNIDLGRGAGNVKDVEWTGKSYGDFITARGGQALVNAVGPNRARLIETGRLSFNDLVDKRTGELFTLDELGFPLGSIIPKKPPTGGTVKKVAKLGAKLPPVKKFPTMKAIEKVAKKMPSNKANSRAVEAATKRLDHVREKAFAEKDYKKYRLLYDEYFVIKKEVQALKANTRISKMGAFANIITPPKGGKINYTFGYGKTTLNKNKKVVADIFSTIEDLLHPSLLAKLPDVDTHLRKKARAHYKNGKKTLRMGDFEDEIWVHEYGHHIEWEGGLYQKALAFRNKRTVGESISRIRKTNEYGYKDKFFDHYVGRTYPFQSTEVISMGLQQMYNDPLGFFDSDPEYFEFILKVMWGEL